MTESFTGVQRSKPETNDILTRLIQVRIDLQVPLLESVDGDPWAGRDPYDAAWQPFVAVWLSRPRPPREALLTAYATERGRISATEAKSLLGTSANTARGLLDELVRAGNLRLGQERRRGRGVYYVPAPGGAASGT